VRANDIAAIKGAIYRSFIQSIATHGERPLRPGEVLRLYCAQCTDFVRCVAER
jgi:hypothetical protein